MEADQHIQAEHSRLASQIYRSAPPNDYSHPKCNNVGQPSRALFYKIFTETVFGVKFFLQLTREFGTILGYSSLLFQPFKVFSQRYVAKTCVSKSFKGPEGNAVSFHTPTGQAGVLLSDFYTLQDMEKIREVLLFSSFSAFPKQKLKFYRDEVVIYNTCKEQAST